MLIKIIALLVGVLLYMMVPCLAQSTVHTVSIAPGGAIKLKAQAVGAAGYQWIKNGSPIAGAVHAEYTVTTIGMYSVVSYNADGCSSEPAAPINVSLNHTLANADLVMAKSSESRGITVNDIFEYSLKIKNNGPDVASNVNVKDQLPEPLILEQLAKPTIGVAIYNPATRLVNWDISTLAVGQVAELNFKVKATKGGIVSNTATISALENDPSIGNNTSTDDKPIIAIKVPNVFTPNDDGKNDQFRIAGLEYFSENEISIVNRWGNVVYQKVGYRNDWTANGLTDGTYFYVFRVKMANAQWQEFKGYVTVVR